MKSDKKITDSLQTELSTFNQQLKINSESLQRDMQQLSQIQKNAIEQLVHELE